MFVLHFITSPLGLAVGPRSLQGGLFQMRVLLITQLLQFVGMLGNRLYKVLRRMWNRMFYLEWQKEGTSNLNQIWCHSFPSHKRQ